MMLQRLASRRAACVLIDFQQRIRGLGTAPRSGPAMVATSATLAQRCREVNALIVLITVDWGADFGDALRQPVDQPAALPSGGLSPKWCDFPAELAVEERDIKIAQRQWSAFYGTGLNLQLRRRGIETIVLVGDMMSCGAPEHHASRSCILPQLGLVRRSRDVLEALAGR